MPYREEYRKALGRWIRMHRELRGWTQNDVAYELRAQGLARVTHTMVSNWEIANHAPSAENLMALARLFGEFPPSPADSELRLSNTRAKGRQLASRSSHAA